MNWLMCANVVVDTGVDLDSEVDDGDDDVDSAGADSGAHLVTRIILLDADPRHLRHLYASLISRLIVRSP